MAAFAVVLLLGPAQTVAGKYAPRPPVPLPARLPADVSALCLLIESGHETPALFAALGEALQKRGDGALAYRAFDRAHGAHPDPRWVQARKDECEHVPDAVIRYERHEAERWVAGLNAYRASRRRAGRDPDDLTEFYERWGRPEENLDEVVRGRRLSWASGVAGLLIGVGFMAASRRLPRRVMILPAAAGVLCLLGPVATGTVGLFYWGAGFTFAGALVVSVLGRARA